MSIVHYNCDYHEVYALENIWRSTISSIHHDLNKNRVLILYNIIPFDCIKIIFDFLKNKSCERVHRIRKIDENTFIIL